MAANDAQTLYYFDCLDGTVGERYWSLEELGALTNPQEPATFTERAARRMAHNLEAELYRCKVVGGEVVDSVCIYDPFSF